MPCLGELREFDCSVSFQLGTVPWHSGYRMFGIGPECVCVRRICACVARNRVAEHTSEALFPALQPLGLCPISIRRSAERPMLRDTPSPRWGSPRSPSGINPIESQQHAHQPAGASKLPVLGEQPAGDFTSSDAVFRTDLSSPDNPISSTRGRRCVTVCM